MTEIEKRILINQTMILTVLALLVREKSIGISNETANLVEITFAVVNEGVE